MEKAQWEYTEMFPSQNKNLPCIRHSLCMHGQATANVLICLISSGDRNIHEISTYALTRVNTSGSYIVFY